MIFIIIHLSLVCTVLCTISNVHSYNYGLLICVDWFHVNFIVTVYQKKEYKFIIISLKFSVIVLEYSFLQFCICSRHFPVHFMGMLSWAGNFPGLFSCHDNLFKGQIWTHCNCNGIM